MYQVRASFLALWGLLALVTGCGDGEPEVAEILRPVRSEVVYQTGGGRTRSFAGVIRAGQEIVLSFKVSGTIEQLDVRQRAFLLGVEVVQRK